MTDPLYYVPVLARRFSATTLARQGLTPAHALVYPLYLERPSHQPLFEHCEDSGQVSGDADSGFQIDYEIQPRPVADALALVEADIGRQRDAALAALRQHYSEAEQATWATQLAEAQRWQQDPRSPVPMLTRLAAARGVALAELAARICSRADQLAEDSGEILGQAQAALRQLAQWRDALDSQPDSLSLTELQTLHRQWRTPQSESPATPDTD